MCQKLPFRGFEWVDEKQLLKFDENFVKEYDNKDVGYVLEVDLEYPIDLYDKHNAYPLEPEQMCITFDKYSPYNKKIVEELKNKHDIKLVVGNSKKLTPNLFDKERYVCNIRNLKMYLELGMKIKRFIE